MITPNDDRICRVLGFLFVDAMTNRNLTPTDVAGLANMPVRQLHSWLTLLLEGRGFRDDVKRMFPIFGLLGYDLYIKIEEENSSNGWIAAFNRSGPSKADTTPEPPRIYITPEMQTVAIAAAWDKATTTNLSWHGGAPQAQEQFRSIIEAGLHAAIAVANGDTPS